jgi:hypothetical protein
MVDGLTTALSPPGRHAPRLVGAAHSPGHARAPAPTPPPPTEEKDAPEVTQMYRPRAATLTTAQVTTCVWQLGTV